MASLSTPGAIVLGFTIAGALTGAGAYFGLRGRASARDERASTATTTSASGSIANAASPEAAQAAIASANRSAEADVRAALAATHAKLVTDCWAPSAAKKPDPPSTTIAVDFNFDGEGHVVTRALHPDRSGRFDVASCVQRELESPTITPTGQPAHASVAITLP